MNRKTLFIAYLYMTVFIGIVVIFWFSTLNNLIIYKQDLSLTVERITYFIAFGFLQILIFRALIGTFRLTVDKLSFSRNKQERAEDREFRLIVETLIMTNAVLISTIVAIANDYVLRNTPGREGGAYTILVSILGVLVAALISYSWPLLNSIEATLIGVEDRD